MRTYATLATLFVVLAFVFWAPAAKAHCPHGGEVVPEHCGGAAAPPPVRPQYLGNSGVDRDGDGGLFARHADCAAAFEGALMCTSRMIVEGGAAPDAIITEGREWVNPEFVANVGTTADVVDFSGIVASSNSFNCGRWGSGADGFGLVLLTTVGGSNFMLADCATERSAACCR